MTEQTKKRGTIIVVSLQALALLCVFHAFFLAPQSTAFNNAYDGLKNYFTYHSYVQQDKALGFSKMEQMNYPYGEYVFYTDNTPIFALAVKWFSHHIIDLSAYDLALYNWFMILGVLFSTLLLVWILSRFISQWYLVFIPAFALPWISPQLLRLIIGHHNLSLSWILLSFFLVLIVLFERRMLGPKKLLFPIISLFFLVIIASFIHLYYLLIFGVFAGFFLLFLVLSDVRNIRIWSVAITAGFSLLAAFATVVGTINLVDQYYDLRQAAAGGYNYSPWTFHFDALFSSYSFNSIYLPFLPRGGVTYESYGYLGSFVLFGLLFLLIASLVIRLRKLTPSKQVERPKWLRGFFIASFFLFMISLGEYPKILGGSIQYDNWLSPFYFLSDHVERIKQFRVVARFEWPFFWGVYFLLLFALDRLIQQAYLPKFTKISSIVLLVFLLVDTFDFMRHFHINQTDNVLSKSTTNERFKTLDEQIDYSKYQAILPIPYYHVGSEDMRYILDPYEPWCTVTFQLSSHANLPLMSTKLSRTAVSQNKALLDIFIEPELDPILQSKLNEKPVLVFVNLDENAHLVPTRQPAGAIAKKSIDFPKDKELKLLFKNGNYEYYEWFPLGE